MAEENKYSSALEGADEDMSMDASHNTSMRNDEDAEDDVDDSSNNSEAASSTALDQFHDASMTLEGDAGSPHPYSVKFQGDVDDPEDEDDDESLGDDQTENPDEDEEDPTETNVDDDEDDEISVKSHATDAASTTKEEAVDTKSPGRHHQPPKKETSKSKPKKAAATTPTKKGRAPSVKGLVIPFRTIKKSMKLDPDIPIVQNEAAIMTTLAVELFLKRLAVQAHRNAKNRGRNTVQYQDIAEARANNKALAFLEPLLP